MSKLNLDNKEKMPKKGIKIFLFAIEYFYMKHEYGFCVLKDKAWNYELEIRLHVQNSL